jgi:UDP-N-acetylmuramyl pentapeptide phosphotransferase/UDP-N-acetylglucosamine-1-phosphate transferase
MIFYPPIIAASVTLLAMFLLLRSAAARRVQDIPNERSLHRVPVPRIGGMALMLGVFAGWVALRNTPSMWLIIPLVGLVVLSALDDIHGLPVRLRLLAHVIAASVFLLGAGFEWWTPILLLPVVWMTNLFNFMDGADGLAGGMALFGFGWYGAAAWVQGASDFALMNFSLCAAAFGFLLFNFHPARVFMGDAGSIPLGFLAAAVGLLGWQQGLWPLWFPPLVFSPFVMDATVTLVKRIARGEKLSQAHRGHYYQRLVQMGCGHRNTALAGYLLMGASGICALWGVRQEAMVQLMVLAAWLLIYFGLMVWLDARWKRFVDNRAGAHA